jgi:hypothetical protein
MSEIAEFSKLDSDRSCVKNKHPGFDFYLCLDFRAASQLALAGGRSTELPSNGMRSNL